MESIDQGSTPTLTHDCDWTGLPLIDKTLAGEGGTPRLLWQVGQAQGEVWCLNGTVYFSSLKRSDTSPEEQKDSEADKGGSSFFTGETLPIATNYIPWHQKEYQLISYYYITSRNTSTLFTGLFGLHRCHRIVQNCVTVKFIDVGLNQMKNVKKKWWM